MKNVCLAIALSLSTFGAYADTQSCHSDIYHDYISASLEWYEDLVSVAIEKDESLKDVAEWFLSGRRTHFLFNQTAVDWYLDNDREQLRLDQSVESWLAFDQEKIRDIANSDHPLALEAKKVYELRQSKPHQQNYELRSAFAELLSHPGNIDEPLTSYNDKMARLSTVECKK